MTNILYTLFAYISFIVNLITIIIFIKNKHEMDISNILNIQLSIATFFQTLPLLFFFNDNSFVNIFQSLYSATFNLTISLITTFIPLTICISFFYSNFFNRYQKLLSIIFSMFTWILTLIYERYLMNLRTIKCKYSFCFYEYKKVFFPLVTYFILFIINGSSNILMIVAIYKIVNNNNSLRKIFMKKLFSFLSGSIFFYGTYFFALILKIKYFPAHKKAYDFWNFINNLFQSLTGIFVNVVYIYSESFIREIKDFIFCNKKEDDVTIPQNEAYGSLFSI